MAGKKKIAVKRQAWNKGLQVGKRDGFTPAQVKRIRGVLKARGAAGVRDLALFSTAIDTMLHGHNLLPLVVSDVQSRNGSIRTLIEVAQSKGAPPVRCALSKSTAMALEKWITSAGLNEPGEIERAIVAEHEANDGVIVTVSPLSTVNRDRIIALAARYKVPAVYPLRYFAVSGGLISYGPDRLEPYRRAAGYVDRILKGEKPAELPVQEPTKYEPVINLKTAGALGITVPPTMLALADEVIE